MKALKLLLLLAVLRPINVLFAQKPSFSAVYRVTESELRLKWLPSDYTALTTLLREGATVSLVELSGSNQAATADYTTASTHVITPAQTRLNALPKEDSVTERVLAILEPFMSSDQTLAAASKEFAFAMAVLELTVSEELSNAAGCQLTLPHTLRSRMGVRITVKGLPAVYSEIDASSTTIYPAVTGFNATLDRKKTIELTWHSAAYTTTGYAYYIEKSLDRPVAGKRLLSTPYFPMRTQYEKADKADFIRDANLTEGKTHFYRLVGLNYFGQEVLFSEWQKVYVPRHLNATIEIDTLFAAANTRIVSGKLYPLADLPTNLKSYLLFRSSEQKGPFTVIAQEQSTAHSFRFSIDMPHTGDQYYYKVGAISTDNDTVFSGTSYLFTLDQEPPTAPTLLSGTISEKGIVTLTWKAPADTDIQGYRIYRANHKKEDFTEQNRTLSGETQFTDTVRLDNLTSQVYYCVRAVDHNFNNSGFSDTLLLIKPDTIAPVPAMLRAPIAADSTIRLSWINSSSEDIRGYVLIRYSGNTADTLLRWSDTLTFYTDRTPVPGNPYRYQILSSDKSGNSSLCAARQLYYEPGYRKALSGLKAEIRSQEKCILLTWQAPVGEVFSYQIYRTSGDGKPVLFKTIEDGQLIQYSDPTTVSGNTYRYSVKYILRSGIHSLPASTAEIRF